MGSFLDVVLPPLLLLALVAGLLAVAVFVAAGRLRLWASRRRAADCIVEKVLDRGAAAHRALASARDALATVISDPGLSGDTRDQALTAYQAVTTAITKENGCQ